MSSSSACDTFRLDDAQQYWDRLTERLEAFVDAWEKGSAPSLSDFLPSEPPAFRRLALPELIKVDLEYRSEVARQPKRLEEYAGEFPEIAGPRMPCDLIYEEFHVRRQAGETVEPDEYFERFPAQAEELKRLVGLESPHVTTALFGAERTQQFRAGEHIDDFDLITQLGRGAFATVFLARQCSMQRLVAVKISSDRGDEPQTMAQLDHPHIVRVYDQHRLADKRLRLLYMQYIPGGTLQTVVEHMRRVPSGERSGKTLLAAIDACLESRGEAPPADSLTRQRLGQATWSEAVCWLGSRLAGALHYAHQRGVLHRDVKPANILVGADAGPKLVDFNISFSSKLDGATPAAYFGGSLAYMSPEQLEASNPAHGRGAADLDGRSDLYSLSVVLWELLTGRRPFDDIYPDGNWTETLQRMTEARRRGLAETRLVELPADRPPGLGEALFKALAPDRDARFADAGELARQLDLCLQPEVQRLLRSPRGSWRSWARRHVFVSLLAAGIVPNAVFSAFNLLYNKRWIPIVFDPQVLIVGNVVAYALSLALCIFAVWPLVRALGQAENVDRLDTATRTRLRRRSLVLGDAITWCAFAGWVASGFLFPYGLRAGFGLWDYLHFMTSQVLCGLIAGTLTFFCTTFLLVRVYYPALMRAEDHDNRAIDTLVALGRRVWVYFGLAVSVPFLAVTLLVFIDSSQPAAFAVLGLAGLVGFGLSFRLALLIRDDLGSLVAANMPATDSLSGGGIDSFLTGSRRGAL